MQSLDLFHPLIKKWFLQKYDYPTDIQEKSWHSISKKENILAVAPTGSGKTLTAFLYAINNFVNGVFDTGKVNVLYISPLKALNNDIRRNLLTPISELKDFFNANGENFPSIRVLTRSQDTSYEDRKDLAKNPPEIFITTPESLNIILTSKKNRNILKEVKIVILDEIHYLANTKRGTHLITAIDRISLLAGEFQRIALSATVSPENLIAEFVAGFKIPRDLRNPIYEKREINVIKSSINKEYSVTIKYPQIESTSFDNEPIWLALRDVLKDIIKKNTSTLIFANSRRIVEKMTRYINEEEEEELVYSHHGSLSKELRLAVEQRLKIGELKSIIATNSLELGIDIGHLNKVILIQTPFAISQAIQRIGRAGHSFGEVSSGDIYPVFGKDFIYAGVVSKGVIEKNIEDIKIVEMPLDVLSQILLSMTIVEKWDIDELFNFIRSSYPYRNLKRREFDLIIDMLCGKYSDSKIKELAPKVFIDKIDNTIKGKEGLAYLLYLSGGTIPDRGIYNLRLMDSKTKIGELDEEFVWERNLGDAFPLGNQIWRIMNITHNDVEVVPTDSRINIIPFWKGDEVYRDFSFSEKIALFLEDLNARLNDDNLKVYLEKKYFMDNIASLKLIDFLKYQKDITGTDLPHRHNLLIEHFDDPMNKADNKQVVIHTFWGNRLNKPFGIALQSYWEDKYKYPLQIFTDNDSIMIALPHDFNIDEIYNIAKNGNLEELIRKKLESSGYFAAHFRENAGRSLLLPKQNFNKRMPLWLNRLRAKKLLEAVSKYKDFPILLETWRECLLDDFDLENLRIVLDEIVTGKIKMTQTTTNKPSPFSDDIIWKETNLFMYQEDMPSVVSHSNLKTDLIKEIISSSHLRPKIPLEIINSFDKKLKRILPDYAPQNDLSLIEWINERILITEDEFINALTPLINNPDEVFSNKVKERLLKLKLNNRSCNFITTIECIPFILKSFEGTQNHIEYDLIYDEFENKLNDNIAKIVKRYKIDDEKDYTADLFDTFISYYAVITIDELIKFFGLEETTIKEIILKLVEDEKVILDKISNNAVTEQIANIDNFEILLRIYRNSKRGVFKPLPIERLQLFLAHYNGLTNRNDGIKNTEAVIEKLFGFYLPPNIFEEAVLPARFEPYFTSFLDSLMNNSNLIWTGKNNKIAPLLLGDVPIFFENEENNKILEKLFIDKNAKYDFFTILNNSKMASSELVNTLWKLFFSAEITNDSFETIRKGIMNDFKVTATNSQSNNSRISYNKWRSDKPTYGNYFIINKDSDFDPIEKQEILKERVRVLFTRYGILFKEILEDEIPLFSWREIIKTLRIMEFSGEIFTGVFFENISGMQFICNDAYRILQSEINDDVIYWFSCYDPVSICGKGIEKLKDYLPRKDKNTYLVYHGPNLVLIGKSTFKKIEIRTSKENPFLAEYFDIFKTMLTRQFNPMQKIVIKEINDIPALKSEYLGSFKQFGFISTHKGLELWKKY